MPHLTGIQRSYARRSWPLLIGVAAFLSVAPSARDIQRRRPAQSLQSPSVVPADAAAYPAAPPARPHALRADTASWRAAVTLCSADTLADADSTFVVSTPCIRPDAPSRGSER